MPAARRLRVALLALAAGCWTSPTSSTALSNHTAPAPASSWHMTPHGLGPLGAASIATKPGLEKELPRLRVTPSDPSERSGIVYDVFDGPERLFYVVPDDASGYVDGDERHYAETIFAIFAVSPRVSVAGRTWRVGQPFTDDAGLDHCECWGEDEVTACFKLGTHLRVIFEQPCLDAKRQGAHAMIGKPVARIMWKRVIEPPGLLDD